jgi:hypothetical protein
MSDFAQRANAQNKRTRDPFLDLGKCELIKLPVQLADLDRLESLSLSSFWFPRGRALFLRSERGNPGQPMASSETSTCSGDCPGSAR